MKRTYVDAGVLIAAARAVGATEFVTTEKPDKPIHRATSISIVSIHPT